MAWTAKRVWIFGEALLDGLARLADVAPNKIVVLAEETDWGLVGGDLHDAMESEVADAKESASDRDEELVEA